MKTPSVLIALPDSGGGKGEMNRGMEGVGTNSPEHISGYGFAVSIQTSLVRTVSTVGYD